MKNIWLGLGIAASSGLAAYFFIPPAICVNRKAPLPTQTAVTLNQLKVGLVAYYTEYGVFPSAKENALLMPILRGVNPRKIVFAEFPKETLNSKGEAIDAWGNPLRFRFLTSSNFIIESAGKDKTFGTKDDLTNKK